MTPIEIIALILIILVVVKIIILLIKPKTWIDFSKKLWVNQIVVSIVALVLAAVILYYLLQELTIIQILATAAFVSCLIVIGLVGHIKEIIRISEKQIKDKNLWKKNWLYTLVWIILLVWGAYTLFM